MENIKKSEKGITLVALIVTIVILIILAIVTINAIQGDSLLGKAQAAADKYKEKANEEDEILKEYLAYLENDGTLDVGELTPDKLNTVLDENNNTVLTDGYENKITIPAGFKILVDSTTSYSENNITVTSGIVVEDAEGNQFVWIPVGAVSNKYKTVNITLARYASFVKDENGAYTISQNATNYADEIEEKEWVRTGDHNEYGSYGTLRERATSENSKVSNARSIKDFCESSIGNGGFYIGRYQARTTSTEERNSNTNTLTNVTCKKENSVYDYISQSSASEKAKNMYANGYSTGTFSSDLVNSYAWDTALVFFQEFGGSANFAYTSTHYVHVPQIGEEYIITRDGESVICNVEELADDKPEWTTEEWDEETKMGIYFWGLGPYVCVGGSWTVYRGSGRYYAAGKRNYPTDEFGKEGLTFRVVLYCAK